MKIRSAALAALSVLALAIPVLPATAQEPAGNSILFDGMGFSFDPSLGASVNVTRVPGQSPQNDSPAAPDSPHLTFSLYGPKDEYAKVPRVGATPTVVTFFRIADLDGYTFDQQEVQRLRAILADRPDPAMLATGNDRLPYLPPQVDAAQMMRARVGYVDLPGISGITYITAFGQDVYPFTSDRFQYVFEGLSTDGAWAVSAIFDLTTDLFPAKVSQKDANRITASQKAYDAYLAASRATLEGAARDAFSPTLDAADALIASIVIEGAPASEPAPPAPSASPAA